MSKKISRNINLTEGSIVEGLIKFAIPLLLTNFLQQLYNTADPVSYTHLTLPTTPYV